MKGKLAQEQLDALKRHSKQATTTDASKASGFLKRAQELDESNDKSNEVGGRDSHVDREMDDSLQGVWDLALPPEIAAKSPKDQRLRLVFAGDWYPFGLANSVQFQRWT